MEPEKEILLKELELAHGICNETGAILRKDVRLFVLLLSAILAFSAYKGQPDILTQLLLLFVGFFISLLFSITVYRSRAYYQCYLERAKEIEKKLGMELLESGKKIFGNDQFKGRLEKIDWKIERFVTRVVGLYAECISNKLAYLSLTLLFAGAFLILFIVRIFQICG